MRHGAYLLDPTSLIKLLKTGIAICVHPASVVIMIDGSVAFAINAELIIGSS
jgi:hypothetical protein